MMRREKSVWVAVEELGRELKLETNSTHETQKWLAKRGDLQ